MRPMQKRRTSVRWPAATVVGRPEPAVAAGRLPRPNSTPDARLSKEFTEFLKANRSELDGLKAEIGRLSEELQGARSSSRSELADLKMEVRQLAEELQEARSSNESHSNSPPRTARTPPSTGARRGQPVQPSITYDKAIQAGGDTNLAVAETPVAEKSGPTESLLPDQGAQRMHRAFAGEPDLISGSGTVADVTSAEGKQRSDEL